MFEDYKCRIESDITNETAFKVIWQPNFGDDIPALFSNTQPPRIFIDSITSLIIIYLINLMNIPL